MHSSNVCSRSKRNGAVLSSTTTSSVRGSRISSFLRQIKRTIL